MKELEYPFDAEEIIQSKKAIKKKLLNDENNIFLEKKIAILGGWTTRNIKDILELFLLNYDIKPIFYESEYNRYYEDGMFPNAELEKFAPDVIYICTSTRNISFYPELSDNLETIEEKLSTVFEKYRELWLHLKNTYGCPVIQNNFEYPYFRLMGNKDASDVHGRVSYVSRLNMKFYEYAQAQNDFYICDINYLSASYGLDKWSDPYYWHMYKYGVAVPAIPYLSYNVANIIKSIYGRNKKVLNLDLDNTLWGGIIGDDGVENIEIGQETPLAQAYTEFQEYIKLHKQLGVLLTINSKNESDIAFAGINRPDSILKQEDFVIIKTNWNSKDQNLVDTANEINLLPESFVFVDDNPAERALVREQHPKVAVPEIKGVEQYIQVLDRAGFFEVTSFSDDDQKRTEMYKENKKRNQLQKSCTTYEDYLKSLEMKAEIKSFELIYLSRIAQLTNKSNQFNLTTRRYNQSEIRNIANNPDYITLYGTLKDKFGDNGVVSIIIGKIAGKKRNELHLELWLMSCRVLKRNMEYAMMDVLMERARLSNIGKIIGYYYPTAKNTMVKNFYELQGFTLISEDENGNSVWEYEVKNDYVIKQQVIEVNRNN